MSDKKFFPWVPMPGATTASKPTITSVSMGDGYEERAESGLNSNLKTRDLTLRVKPDEAVRVNEFLDEMKGVYSFIAYSFTKRKNVLYVCQDWSEKEHKHYSEFSLKFREVVS